MDGLTSRLPYYGHVVRERRDLTVQWTRWDLPSLEWASKNRCPSELFPPGPHYKLAERALGIDLPPAGDLGPGQVLQCRIQGAVHLLFFCI